MAALGEGAFTSDIEFCPTCGSIFPLPGATDFITCTSCGFKVTVKDRFENIEIHSKIVFNNREAKMGGLTSDDFEGPTVERKCPKCDNEEMTFATRQTRSADEGQTVFYTCPRCKFQETEYS